MLLKAKKNKQPAIVDNQINGYPVVRFDGQVGSAGDRLLFVSGILNGLTEGEIFTVLKAASALPSGDKGLWYLGNISKYPLADGTIEDGFGSDESRSATTVLNIEEYNVYNISSKTGEWISRINNTVLVESSTNSVDWKNSPKIGRSSTFSFAGDFAEILLFDRELTISERDDILTYLGNKYAISVTGTASSDTDFDGLPDSWELEYFGNLDQRVNDDPDGDGLSNIDEYIAGTNPAETVSYNPPPGMFLWLMADTGIVEGASEELVAIWEDQSGNSNNASQSSANRQPAVVTSQANEYPVVRFDGLRGSGGDRLELKSGLFYGHSEGEIFAVIKATSALPSNDKGLWMTGSSGNSSYPLTDGTISDNYGSDTVRNALPMYDIAEYHVYSVSSKAEEWISRINSTVLVESTTNTVDWKKGPKIGRSSGSSFDGDFAEILMFDRVLSAQERDDVLTYLASKYNISIDTNEDTDGDKLRDSWEVQFYGDLSEDGTGDSDGDGIFNIDEFNGGTDPTEFYNGVIPALNIVSGNNQTSELDTYLISPLVVSVSDASGDPLINAPVEFSVTSGGAQVAEDTQGTQLGTTLNVRTNIQGEASAYVLLEINESENIQINSTVSTVTQSPTVVFNANITANDSSDIILPGAVNTIGNAVVHAIIDGTKGEPKTLFMSGLGQVDIDVPRDSGTMITFYSFTFRPSVSENPEEQTQLNVAGALIDYSFYENIEDIASGNMTAVNGASEFEWIDSGIFYGLEDHGESKVSLNLTLRLDNEQGVWDLYFQDKLWMTDMEYIQGAESINIIMGSEQVSTLAELLVTKSNPLFEDINKDGLPDSFEIEQGFTPTTNNRNALLPGGEMTLLEFYLSKM